MVFGIGDNFGQARAVILSGEKPTYGVPILPKMGIFSYLNLLWKSLSLSGCKIKMMKLLKNQSPKWLAAVQQAGVLVAVIILLLAMAPVPTGGPNGNTENPSNGGGGNVEQFAVKSYSFQGEYLMIQYYVPFPGMTKVKLLKNGELLWRGQYVDEKKGDCTIFFRAGKLVSGEDYTFQFSYKGVERTLPVVAQ
jgi:hypothetical protein